MQNVFCEEIKYKNRLTHEFNVKVFYCIHPSQTNINVHLILKMSPILAGNLISPPDFNLKPPDMTLHPFGFFIDSLCYTAGDRNKS
jgi:hypothetical protein